MLRGQDKMFFGEKIWGTGEGEIRPEYFFTVCKNCTQWCVVYAVL